MKLFGWLIHGVNILQLMNAYDTLQVAVKVCTLHSRPLHPCKETAVTVKHGETTEAPSFLRSPSHVSLAMLDICHTFHGKT